MWWLFLLSAEDYIQSFEGNTSINSCAGMAQLLLLSPLALPEIQS